MLISLSKSKSAEHWAHKHFETVDAKSVSEFAKLICDNHWSPIIWRDNHRLGGNFNTCGLCVLDFDNGELTVEDAIIQCRNVGYFFVLGTTKSHGVEKSGMPACDRFRLIMKFSETITDAEHYKQQMKRCAKLWPSCDRGALDAARKYAPCKAIVAAANGRPIKVTPPEQKVRWATRYDFIPRPAEEKFIPDWVKEKLTLGIAPGERNNTLYRVCKSLQKNGFAKDEALSLISGSNISMEFKEVESVVRSAYR